MDECHFQQHGSRCLMWVPPEEKDPVVLHAPTRKSIACFGAVNLRTGRLVTLFSPVFNAETFKEFLLKLVRYRTPHRTMRLICDNAKYHHATMLQPFIDDHRRVLRLDFLPPYSPELNPIERVWKRTRTIATHNQHFETLQDLVDVVAAQFDVWARPNLELQRLCGKI